MNTTSETMGKGLLPRMALIACGSFSPPTPMHLRMFEIARDHFKLAGTHTIIGGIVSPVHDGYGKKDLAPHKHRLEMVKLALRNTKWIKLSDWEATQKQHSRTLHVLQYHQNTMNDFIQSKGCSDNAPCWLPEGLSKREDCVKLRLLCGADLLESFAEPGLWSDEDIKGIVGEHGLVVVTRAGANPQRFIFESDVLSKFEKNITLITNWVVNDVSSTMIRRFLRRQLSVKYLIDDKVIAYCKKHGLYGSKPNDLTSEELTENVLKQEDDNANDVDLELDEIEGEDKNEDQANEEDINEPISLLSGSSSDNESNSNSDGQADGVGFCCKKSSGILEFPRSRPPGQAVQLITYADGSTEIITDESERQSKRAKVSSVQDI